MATLKLGKEPGVYIQEEVNPTLAITGEELKVAGLVGHAAPTLKVADIQVVRGDSGATDTLPYETVESVLCISDYIGAYGSNLPQYVQLTATEPTDPRPAEKPVDPGAGATEEERAEYEAAMEIWNAWAAYDAAVEEADYSVAGNVITWLHPEVASKVPQVGFPYYVTAIIKKGEDHYLPKQFSDIEAVREFYGPELYEVNGETVVSEITVGARLMFDNGANLIWICEAKPTAQGTASTANIKAAIDLLDDIDIQSLVVMHQDAEIQQYIKSRVVIDSNVENQHERVGFVCALSDDVDAIKAQCLTFKEQRIVNVVPSKVTILVEDENGVGQEFEVQSTFAAAAAVGMLVDNTRLVSEPLTRKTLVGIYGASKVYNRSQIEVMSGAGAFILKDNDGVVIVNQSVTTDTSNQNNRDLSVVLIKDEVMKSIRRNLDRDFIGKAYNRRITPTKIKTAIMTILNNYIGSLVEGYDESDIVVTANPDDTTRVDVKMAFAVLRPLNYIYISYMVTL